MKPTHLLACLPSASSHALAPFIRIPTTHLPNCPYSSHCAALRQFPTANSQPASPPNQTNPNPVVHFPAAPFSFSAHHNPDQRSPITAARQARPARLPTPPRSQSDDRRPTSTAAVATS
ncbi:uncharacterized protein J3D65DRAFT_607568 [Phyllosticta citribraziliensis]|uniref:Uncharacterized protein n=1 Tax=Phyllosticta citribraziliensis TaxID=989973 RepID=A0ABR1L3R9_9PEZI